MGYVRQTDDKGEDECVRRGEGRSVWVLRKRLRQSRENWAASHISTGSIRQSHFLPITLRDREGGVHVIASNTKKLRLPARFFWCSGRFEESAIRSGSSFERVWAGAFLFLTAWHQSTRVPSKASCLHFHTSVQTGRVQALPTPSSENHVHDNRSPKCRPGPSQS